MAEYLKDGRIEPRPVDAVDKGPIQAVVIFADNGNGQLVPTSGVSAGTGGTVTAERTTPAPPVDSVIPASPVTTLTNPYGASLRYATVHVTEGAVLRSIGADPTIYSPRLSPGESERMSTAEYAAYRLMGADGTQARVHVEFEVLA